MLLLVAIATVVPELITGSTPIIAFLNPATILFLVIGYGIPVLLIRELIVRRSLSLPAAVCLGLTYGIVNEGLFARTIIQQHSLPIPQYDHYGFLIGISLPWTAGICTWHAFASVLFPIALTHRRFPDSAQRTWISGRACTSLTLFLVIFSCLSFMRHTVSGNQGTPRLLLILIGSIAAIVAIALNLPSQIAAEDDRPTNLRMCLLAGFSVIIPFDVCLSAVANSKLPIAIYFTLLVLSIVAYGRFMVARGWQYGAAFAAFGIGWYAHNAFESLLVIGLAQHAIVIAAETAVLDIIMLRLMWKLVMRGARAQIAPITSP